MKLAFKLMRIVFRFLTDGIILPLLMLNIWILGVHIGSLGAGTYREYFLPTLGSLGQILFAVIELLVGIWFFIVLRRQLLPGGIKELLYGALLGETLSAKVKYFPGIFALGVVAGLVGNAVVIFIEQATSYFK